jgi:arylsulfatase A-like enzyme
MFLKLSYHRPHSPYDPPARILDRFSDPADPLSSYELSRNINSTSWDSQFYANFTTNPGDMDKAAWNGDPGPDAAASSRRGYLASIAFVDESVGQVLDYISERDLMDDFFVLWVADHGDMQGDHNLWRKGYPWQASSNVPMVIKPSSNIHFQPNTVSSAVVEVRDVAPTLYDVAGTLSNALQQDPGINGKSLLPLVSGSADSVREYLDLEHGQVYDPRIHWNAIVDGTMKYIYFANDGSEQLFNITADPLESYDLATDAARIDELAVWRQRLVQQFIDEGRGERWVKNGELVVRTESVVFGDNYPCL